MFGNSAAGSRSTVAGLALAALLGGAGLPGLSGGHAETTSIAWREMGRTWAPDGVLRRGCHQYPYRYGVHPPTRHWILETFLKGPGGKRLASDVVVSGADARRGTKRFDLCRSNTQPGRFTIRAKLTYEDDSNDSHSGWLRPSHFRLRR